MQEPKGGRDDKEGWRNRAETGVLGDEAAEAGEGCGAKHRCADLETNGVGGKVFAKTLRGSGHEAGKDDRQAKPAERESNWSGLRKWVPRKERRTEQRCGETEADEKIDPDAVNDKAKDNSADENAGPINCNPHTGSFRFDASRFGQNGKAPLAERNFETGVNEENNDAQLDDGMSEGARRRR